MTDLEILVELTSNGQKKVKPLDNLHPAINQEILKSSELNTDVL